MQNIGTDTEDLIKYLEALSQDLYNNRTNGNNAIGTVIIEKTIQKLVALSGIVHNYQFELGDIDSALNGMELEWNSEESAHRCNAILKLLKK